jgi:hypothetical protein
VILLTSTSDLVRVVTSSTSAVDVHATFVDLSGSTVTPGRTNTAITTATTTTVVGSPGASTSRTVKTLTLRNKGASPNTCTVLHTDGTTAVEIVRATLQANEAMHYHEAAGFWIADSEGRTKTNGAIGSAFAATNTLNLVVLASDQTNNNATANTAQDITGLSFAVTSGETYWFRFIIAYTAAATTTGAAFMVNGPTTSLLSYRSGVALAAASGTDGETTTFATAYDTPATAVATSAATAGNIATIEGFITPSANGTVIARFRSEVSSSAIVAKAGSILQWVRTL